MNNFYVYQLINPKTNLPFYIGKGQYNRMYAHETTTLNNKIPNNNKLLFYTIKKILRESGEIQYKKILENLSESAALKLEIEEIKKFGRKNDKTGILCNLTTGGEGISGYKHTQKTKKSMTVEAKKPNRIQISTKNLKTAIEKNIGKRKLHKSHDLIVNLYTTMSIKKVQKKLKCDFITLKNYLVEHNLYVPNKNRKLSEQTKNKMKISNLGKRARKIEQYDLCGVLIKTFESITQACCSIGLNKFNISSIYNCATGRQYTAYGYKWKFTPSTNII